MHPESYSHAPPANAEKTVAAQICECRSRKRGEGQGEGQMQERARRTAPLWGHETAFSALPELCLQHGINEARAAIPAVELQITARLLLSQSVTSMQPGAWVMHSSGLAASIATCGVTPQAQNTGTSPGSIGTASP